MYCNTSEKYGTFNRKQSTMQVCSSIGHQFLTLIQIGYGKKTKLRKFRKKVRRFVYSEIVKTCDEIDLSSILIIW